MKHAVMVQVRKDWDADDAVAVVRAQLQRQLDADGVTAVSEPTLTWSEGDTPIHREMFKAEGLKPPTNFWVVRAEVEVIDH